MILKVKRIIPSAIKLTTAIISRRIKRFERIWRNGLVMLMMLILSTAAACADFMPSNVVHPSISQMSPKSSEYIAGAGDDALHMSIAHISLSSAATKAANLVDLAMEPTSQTQLNSPQPENVIKNQQQRETHKRIERSAQPILNDHFSKSSFNNVDFYSVKQKDVSAARRYVEYNIKPTGTSTGTGTGTDTDTDTDTTKQSVTAERTQHVRLGKTLATTSMESTTTEAVAQSSSFLLERGPRPDTSGSPISPTTTSSTAIATTATATATVPTQPVLHSGRQSPSPDIQDIITGIVKLLNGNVNVHANTQGLRRPTASRINNRGPPRISEAQTLPVDYDIQKPALGSSMRPPPYSFDRPDRPFITGVPIPEQIVPPYRPSFVSNRPPWYRNKPRPPITTTLGGGGGGGIGAGSIRRPIPQYKPMPASHKNPAQDVEEPAAPPPQQKQKPQTNHKDEQQVESTALEAAPPTDTTYDSEFSTEEDEKNTQYIEVLENESGAMMENGQPELEEDLKPPPLSASTNAAVPPKKEEHKKKPSKHKANDKKKPAIVEYTTVVESSSVSSSSVPSSYLPVAMESSESSVNIEPSMEEVIFMTTSRTPATEPLQTTEFLQQYTKLSEIAVEESRPSSSIITTPIPNTEITKDFSESSSTTNSDLKATITPTPSSSTTLPPSSAATTTTKPTATASTSSSANYQPRPGIVLDDPEFKPGGRPRPQQRHPHPHPQSLPPRPTPTLPHQVHPTRNHLPPGYGEIFDVTLSAIQGPGSAGGSQQTINIKPFGSYGGGGGGAAGSPPQGDADIIVSGSDPPAAAHLPATTPATTLPQLPAGGIIGGDSSGSSGSGGSSDGGVTPHTRPGTGQVTGSGYAVPETEVVELTATQTSNPLPAAVPQSPQTTLSGLTRPHYRPRTTQPPVRIDTCIVGDDSTCDQAQHERCRTENGVSSCHCRPGYSRRKHREPCRKVISFFLSLRVDRIYDHRIVWDKKLLDRNSEPHAQLSYESIRAIDSAMSMTPYSDEFMDARVNNIYRGDPKFGGSGVFVNLTIKLDESVETLRPNLRSDVQKHLLGVIHRRNNNIGNSVLYVSTPEGSISPLHDLDECESNEYNDCHTSATCSNLWGSFRCVCEAGLRDPWADQPQRAGRECQTCPDAYCNNRGSCSYNDEGAQECVCDSGHYGGQCEIDGEVLGVAIGASVAAVIIIVLTLVCLIMWSRRWQREQKNAMGSPVFGYMNTAPLKSAAALAQPAYQVTLEDRMRWAQIADVMAQSGNHYGAEPIAPTRPSSAMFAYPNLQAMGMGAMGGMTMQSNMQMHQNANLPPVPLPRRLGLSSRSNGMRTLENSSSSEEEDRADLLGRNFQVPRPKSRSNASIANQSGIYYDVDYEPSGNGIGNSSVDHLYSSQNQSSSHHSHSHGHSHSGHNHIPGPQGIPMSTYTSGRAPSSYYMK